METEGETHVIYSDKLRVGLKCRMFVYQYVNVAYIFVCMYMCVDSRRGLDGVSAAARRLGEF